MRPSYAEALYSARSAAESEHLRWDRRGAHDYLPADHRHWHRAFEAQRTLARSGRLRAVGIADLLTAVGAADRGVTAIHYVADFEIARSAMDFEFQWAAARGRF